MGKKLKDWFTYVFHKVTFERVGFSQLSYCKKKTPWELVIVHFAQCKTVAEAMKALFNRGFSVHYIIDRAGQITCVVPEGYPAYHVWGKKWRGASRINHRSVAVLIIADYDSNLLKTSCFKISSVWDNVCQLKAFIVLLKRLKKVQEKYEVVGYPSLCLKSELCVDDFFRQVLVKGKGFVW